MGMVMLQGSLLAVGSPSLGGLDGITRRHLADGAWVDHLPGWVGGADELFDAVRTSLDWRTYEMAMYGEVVRSPRLTDFRPVADLPPSLDVLRDAAAVLSDHYDLVLDRIGCNWYRDGRDAVAWHGDRVLRDQPESLVAIVSLGEARPFRLRPRGGGASIGYRPGRGDLLVMGGSCQRTWQHTVPRVARAGPRISVTFRASATEAIADLPGQPWEVRVAPSDPPLPG